MIEEAEKQYQVLETKEGKVTKIKVKKPEKTNVDNKIYKVFIKDSSNKSDLEYIALDLKNKGIYTYISFENGLYKIYAGAFSQKGNALATVGKMTGVGYKVFIEE